jgi:hypothetical protein
MMALAVIGTMGAGAYVGFNSLNTYAVSSRLYSEAQTAAQNQIDLILSAEPFDVTNNNIPSVLVLGTTTTPNVFIYTDPVSGNAVVTGTMTTTVTDTGSTMSFAGANTNLNIRRATVTVSYNFRNRDPQNVPYNYSVSMNTMRTADR